MRRIILSSKSRIGPCMYHVSIQTHVHEASVDAHYNSNPSRLKFDGGEEFASQIICVLSGMVELLDKL